jgi:hypothetical protein
MQKHCTIAAKHCTIAAKALHNRCKGVAKLCAIIAKALRNQYAIGAQMLLNRCKKRHAIAAKALPNNCARGQCYLIATQTHEGVEKVKESEVQLR